MNLGSSQNADFDPLAALLRIDRSGLRELTSLVANGTDRVVDRGQRWHTAGVCRDGKMVPAVHSIVSVNAGAVRSVVVERVSGDLADQMLVGWDAEGRAVTTLRTTDDQVIMQLSSFEVLPVLLSHHLRLLRALEAAGEAREPVQSDPETINRLLAPSEDDASSPEPINLGSQVGPVSLAWRISAGWTGRDPDLSLIGLNTDSGHWLVDVGTQSAGAAKTLTLQPVSVTQAVKAAGVVVTGRRDESSPSGQPSPSS